MPEIDGGILIGTAATLAWFHAVIGVDHSIPFVVLGRSRGWSLRRTLFITGLCGLAHVGSSVLLGGGGIVLGVAVERLDWVETVRGELAAWLLIGFGLGYAAWAFRRNFRGHRHAHPHTHSGTLRKESPPAKLRRSGSWR